MYARELDGELLTFASSAWLYQDLFVLYDEQTLSLWYHIGGTAEMICIGGVHAGRTVPEITSSVVRWSDWVAAHPESKLMKPRE